MMMGQPPSGGSANPSGNMLLPLLTFLAGAGFQGVVKNLKSLRGPSASAVHPGMPVPPGAVASPMAARAGLGGPPQPGGLPAQPGAQADPNFLRLLQLAAMRRQQQGGVM